MPKVGEPMSEEHKAKIRAALLARGKSPTKRCTKCGLVKDRSEFGVRPNGHSRSSCRLCDKAAWKVWVKNNPDKVAATNRRTSLRRWFGITEAQYDDLLQEQGGVCAICGGTQPEHRRGFLYVDHCHTTQRIRGLLCYSCNYAIGLMKDDPERLRSAARYLERPVPNNALHAKPGLPSGRPSGPR